MQKRILTSFFSLSLSYIFNVKWVDIIKLTESYFMHIVTTWSFAYIFFLNENPIKMLNESGNRCTCGFSAFEKFNAYLGFFSSSPCHFHCCRRRSYIEFHYRHFSTFYALPFCTFRELPKVAHFDHFNSSYSILFRCLKFIAW